MGSPQLHFSIIRTFFLCTLSFYLGTLWCMHGCISDSESAEGDFEGVKSARSLGGYKEEDVVNISVLMEDSHVKKKIDDILEKRVGEELKKRQKTTATKKVSRFGNEMRRFALGAVRTSKTDFTQLYDSGSPVDIIPGTDDVLILYNNPKTIPESVQQDAMYDNGNGLPYVPSAANATAKCSSMNVVYTNDPDGNKQCLAIVGNYQGYHVQRWMRMSEEGGKMNANLPFQSVGRGMLGNGKEQFYALHRHTMRDHWKTLKTYFSSVDDILKELGPIAEKVAVKNTIIVMTCNMGQSELLMNFVCIARRRGLDLSNVLMFPTDIQTQELAEGLGLTTYYDEKNFGSLPSKAAKIYGDAKFVAMMFAKVVSVQLISMLGYDFLFQDVDLVWYSHPLDYFQDTSNPYHNFDMYFQDDGAHTVRYSPMSANSGFYFVRNNRKTRYLFTSLLYMGDFMKAAESHQQVLVALLNEHSSLFGLRVKVLNRLMDEFPCGWHYHRRKKDFMKNIIQGQIKPIVFHMSWTNNKDNKVKFLQQMGDWYLNEKCIQKRLSDIVKFNNTAKNDNFVLFEPCCLSEPKIECHYRDKPSKIPCKDSPPIDEGKPSWW